MAPPILRPYTEWGINLTFEEKKSGFRGLKNKLWFNLFLRITAIFAVFVTVLTVANGTLLSTFYGYKQKNLLISQIRRISNIDLNDSSSVSGMLSEFSDRYGFETEIYLKSGKILYTTRGSQMMDFLIIGHDKFAMSHEELIPTKKQVFADGTVFEQAQRPFDKDEFMLCRKEISDGVFAEIRIKTELIKSSANMAGEFISIVAVICFALSVVWIFFYSRRFSKPLAQMSETTKQMAKLRFERKLEPTGDDEIADLAVSINTMSDSLSSALKELKSANEKLKSEIETERQLDVMRKAFVANVSHELKTPLAIIKGYAEGLKLNVNSASKDEYCDTIIDETDRMNGLVLSILELSRYESGQIPLSREIFDIGVLSSQMLGKIFDGKAIETENLIPENTLIFADKEQIREALGAYLENALSHTNKGGKVTLKTEKNGDKIRVCVLNTGSHIDPEIMPQIWQSFYRGDTSHKREEGRFGLGLSIVAAIMKMHGEEYGVYNTENGVCFWLEVPKNPE
ncbi:MAG: HAMP domain-containing histidine kinase [Clostridia bacterium]|nr:HAMP domain-containing histidine kinase [Clostridia bacterium]